MPLPVYTTSYKPIGSTGKTTLVLHFISKSRMNETLSKISNNYEGVLKQEREGHNFPVTFVPRDHEIYKHIEPHPSCIYVVGIYNPLSLRHELLHAQFYGDPLYRRQVINEWNMLPENTREHITNFLKRLGYSQEVIIDEYQAYKNTEKPNFFGIRL